MGGTSGAVCMPSRAMLLTGRTLFSIEREGQRIPEEHTAMPEWFRHHGYITSHVGKWHQDRESHARCFSTGAKIFGFKKKQGWCEACNGHWHVPVHDFDPRGSYDPDGEITDYVWDVGGSVIASGSDAHRISHTIHTFGTYTATLTVTDNNGVAESSSVNLDIQEPPPLCFVFNVEHVGPRPFDEQHPIILAIYDRSYSRWLEYGPVLTLEVHQDGRYMMLISEMDPQYDPEDGEYALLVIHDLDGTGSPETNYWGFFQLGAADNISTSRASYTILELNEVLTTEYEFVFDDSNSGAIDLSI